MTTHTVYTCACSSTTKPWNLTSFQASIVPLRILFQFFAPKIRLLQQQNESSLSLDLNYYSRDRHDDFPLESCLKATECHTNTHNRIILEKLMFALMANISCYFNLHKSITGLDFCCASLAPLKPHLHTEMYDNTCFSYLITY